MLPPEPAEAEGDPQAPAVAAEEPHDPGVLRVQQRFQGHERADVVDQLEQHVVLALGGRVQGVLGVAGRELVPRDLLAQQGRRRLVDRAQGQQLVHRLVHLEARVHAPGVREVRVPAVEVDVAVAGVVAVSAAEAELAVLRVRLADPEGLVEQEPAPRLEVGHDPVRARAVVGLDQAREGHGVLEVRHVLVDEHPALQRHLEHLLGRGRREHRHPDRRGVEALEQKAPVPPVAAAVLEVADVPVATRLEARLLGPLRDRHRAREPVDDLRRGVTVVGVVEEVEPGVVVREPGLARLALDGHRVVGRQEFAVALDEVLEAVAERLDGEHGTALRHPASGLLLGDHHGPVLGPLRAVGFLDGAEGDDVLVAEALRSGLCLVHGVSLGID